jgi:putative glutamine amidotransferase
MKPVVGITAYAEDATWGHWSLPAALVPLSYVQSVELAGGRPLVVPPIESGIEETLDALDALVFSGGADIDPAEYGDDAHPMTTSQVWRDRAERALLEAALARQLPVLAICRGMQMLNVLRGGSLHQHLPELVGHDGHRESRGAFSEHEVTLAEGSKTAAVLGRRVRVKSTHHQAPGRIGKELSAVATAPDGTVEAVEDRRRPFAIGVLWHPEEEQDKRLFEALVDEARVYRGAPQNARTRKRSA